MGVAPERKQAERDLALLGPARADFRRSETPTLPGQDMHTEPLLHDLYKASGASFLHPKSLESISDAPGHGAAQASLS